jgi:nicotinate phosphoribosyltransferase
MPVSALLTDLYELTMLSGYLELGLHQTPAAFDLYFRECPFQGGYAVMAGLEPALEHLENLRFAEEDLDYLESLGRFRGAFIAYLSAFRFHGKVTAAPEGTPVFPHEPLLTVEGRLAEAQFVETLLLNTICFQTLLATKSARVVRAAAGGRVIEFGLRRAQGSDGGLSAARAAGVGGVLTTSNLLAGKCFDLEVAGTHAHSWVMAFPSELESFRAYARSFPDSCVLLVDTYDTLASGVPNAIAIARELRETGHRLHGIRLDSGDLAYLSREARRMLDEAGFQDVKILASNELDEHVIESVRAGGGCVDLYGVGTKLVTAAGPGGGALGGVYKLVQIDSTPKLKVSSDLAKSTIPARKRLYRAVRPDGSYELDVMALEEEKVDPGDDVFDPEQPFQHTRIPADARLEDVRSVVMEHGKRTRGPVPLPTLAKRTHAELARLPDGCLRFIHPHRYRVALSARLHELRLGLIERARGEDRPQGPPPS